MFILIYILIYIGTDRGGRDPESDTVFARSVIRNDVVIADSSSAKSKKRMSGTAGSSSSSSGASTTSTSSKLRGSTTGSSTCDRKCRHAFDMRANDIIKEKLEKRGKNIVFLYIYIYSILKFLLKFLNTIYTCYILFLICIDIKSRVVYYDKEELYSKVSNSNRIILQTMMKQPVGEAEGGNKFGFISDPKFLIEIKEIKDVSLDASLGIKLRYSAGPTSSTSTGTRTTTNTGTSSNSNTNTNMDCFSSSSYSTCTDMSEGSEGVIINRLPQWCVDKYIDVKDE